MAQTDKHNNNRTAAAQPPAAIVAAAAKPNGAPFVFDKALPSAARAWKPSKPTDKTRDQITVALGSVVARIAGSAVTFPMDVQIVFPDKTTTPEVNLRQPWAAGPGGRGGSPLFGADDDATTKQLVESLGTITDQFLDAYAKLPADQRVDLDTISYDDASALIKSAAGSVRRSLKR